MHKRRNVYLILANRVFCRTLLCSPLRIPTIGHSHWKRSQSTLMKVILMKYYFHYSQVPSYIDLNEWLIKYQEVFMGPVSGSPLQYSCLENPMDRGAWQATVHGVAKSRTPRLSDFTSLHQWIDEDALLLTINVCRLWGCYSNFSDIFLL